MDTRPTTVRVIAPESQYVGKEMVVVATYGDAVYVQHEGLTLCYQRAQVEVVHVRDLDNVLMVAGAINCSVWAHLSLKLREMFGGWNAVLISGWTGQEAFMCVRFEMGTAAARLAAVMEVCAPYGLVVTKPVPKL